MFNLLRRDIIADLLNGRVTVEEFYWRLYRMVAAITIVIFAASLVADVAGINGLNIVLIPVWVIVIGYFGFHPTYITAALAVGGATTLGKDVDRQRIIDGLKAYGMKWKEFFIHTAMFGGVFFLTRFLVPIRNYPFAGMILLGALITLGLWNWLYTEKAVWYRRYVIAIIFIALAVGLFGAFTGSRPAAGENPMSPIRSGLHGVVDDLMYRKTLEVEVSSLQPQKLCGIKEGRRKFSIPEGRGVEVFVGVEKTDITSTVRVNQTIPGESFEVTEGGCVEVSFAIGENVKALPFPRQIIAIRFS